MDIVGILAAIVAALAPFGATPAGPWAQTLVELDGRRSEAFERADPGLLDGVYAQGSTVRSADAVLVRSYARRGWQVERVAFRLIDVDVVASRGRMVTLRVVDQLQPVRVRQEGESWTVLPRDRPTQRRLVLVRTPAGWRISAITRLAG